MSAGDVVFISGATGVNAAGINGPYDGTSESSDGYTLFRKRGDAGVMMEHFAGKWRVKSVTDKGKDLCYACVVGGCALEACTSRLWKEGTGGKGFVDAPGLKVMTGAEAERKVSGCGLPAHEHALLHPLSLPVVCCDACCAGR